MPPNPAMKETLRMNTWFTYGWTAVGSFTYVSPIE
jgi:hypothetical protein